MAPKFQPKVTDGAPPHRTTETPHADASIEMGGGVATPIDSAEDIVLNQGVEVEEIDEKAAQRRRKR